jgi:hypothetical protein
MMPLRLAFWFLRLGFWVSLFLASFTWFPSVFPHEDLERVLGKQGTAKLLDVSKKLAAFFARWGFIIKDHSGRFVHWQL